MGEEVTRILAGKEKDQEKYDSDSVAAVLEASVRELDYELRRFCQIEQKTFSVLAFAGGVLTLSSLTIQQVLTNAAAIGLPCMVVVFLPWVTAFLAIVIGAAWLLHSLIGLPLRRLELDSCLRDEELRKPGAHVRSRLAATYEGVQEANHKLTTRKMALFDKGAKAVKFGLASLVLYVLLLSGVSAYTATHAPMRQTSSREVTNMADTDRQSGSQQQTGGESPKPATGKPQPYRDRTSTAGAKPPKTK